MHLESTRYEPHSIQRGLRSPFNHRLLKSPYLGSLTIQVSKFCQPPVYLFLFACKSNKSEVEIYCHNSSITLLTCPTCFILLAHYAMYTEYPQKIL